MAEIAKWVDELMAAGCMPKVAAKVVAEVFTAGLQAGPQRDPATERRRARDREYQATKRRARAIARESADSGGYRQTLAPTQWLWTEGQGLLRQLGTSEKVARSNIGLWLKAGHDPEAIKQFVVAVHQKGIGDPIPWVTKSLGNARGPNGAGHRTTAAAGDDLIAGAELFERSHGPRRPDRTR